MIKKFDAKILNGKLLPLNSGELAAYLKSLPNGDYIIAIDKQESFRSIDQNSYYWGVVVEVFSKYTGHSAIEMHEIFKAKFHLTTKQVGNEIIEYSESTTLMTTAEFKHYIDNIRAWAMELSLYIPEPNEYIQTTETESNSQNP